MNAALGGSERVNFVDNDKTYRTQCRARTRSEKEIERLGGGAQNVGRASSQPGAFTIGGIARPYANGNFWCRKAERLRGPLYTQKRLFQIALDIVYQRLERRNIEHLNALLSAPLVSRSEKAI